ncbi:MAG TPA: hypothetical protein VFT82_02530 [Candidatus Paceibacterota bacterium]|nr:hypothetical protein [Candidatus Paceibacterota bacterium]
MSITPRHRHDSPEKRALMRVIEENLVDAETSSGRARQMAIYQVAVEKILFIRFHTKRRDQIAEFRRQSLAILEIAHKKASRYSPKPLAAVVP